MNLFNPYRQNCGIIRDFCSKPLLLISAILISLIIVCEFIAGAFTGSFTIISLLNILAAVGIFEFAAYKNSYSAPPKLPVILLTVYFVALIVISTFNIVVWLVYTFGLKYVYMYLPVSPDSQILSGVLATAVIPTNERMLLLAAYILIPLAQILFAVSGIIWMLSIRKSTTSIYLKSNGSIFFAVTSAVNALLTVGTIAFKLLTNNKLLLGSEGFAVTTFNPSLQFSSHGVFISDIFVCVLLTAFFALLAVLAIKYNVFIRKVKNNFYTDISEINRFANSDNKVRFAPNPQFAPNNQAGDYDFSGDTVLQLWDKPYIMSQRSGRSADNSNPNVIFPNKDKIDK